MLGGMLRTTYFSKQNAEYLNNLGIVSFADQPDGEYRTNIQIGELNALNACMAVIKYKQLLGFYSDDDDVSNHLLFNITDISIIGENLINENDN